MGLRLKFNLALLGLVGVSWALFALLGPDLAPPAPTAGANAALAALRLALFIALWLAALNLLLGWLVMAPLHGLLQGAERISTGQLDAPDLPDRGRDELARLGTCFNRMRHSLEKAMQVIAMDSRL